MSPVQSPQIAVPTVTTRPQNIFLTSSFPRTHPSPRQNYTRVHPHISWGDPPTPPSSSHIRVVFQNCNTLSRDHFTRFSYLNKLMTLQPHIVGLAETNLNWSHFPTKTSVYSSLKARWPHLQVATAHLEGAFPNCPSSQAGGCLQLISGRTSGRVHNTFSDPMGRWCSQTLQSKSNQKISFITAYRVCQTARSGPLTAYEQQRRHLITHSNAISPHPRDAMLADLTTYIQSLQKQQHQIFLMWDANSTLADPNIKTFMATCHLYDLQHRCISAIPINTSARGRHIDFLFGTEQLRNSLRKCGILNFNDSPLSDHRALFADFDEIAIFQGSTASPTIPCQRLLRINNPTQCQQYIKLVKNYFSQHKVEERSNHLHTLSQTNTPVESLSLYYDALDRDITKALLHAEKRSAKASYGSPWSPTLMQKGQELIFWKHRCSDFRQYADSLASIPDISILASRPDHSTIIKNRYSLSYSLNCLHAARYSLDECHLVAAQLRHDHLTDRARHAASTSNTSAETALNNILKAEAAIATFRISRSGWV